MPPYKLLRQCKILFERFFVHNFILENEIDNKYFREFDDEEDKSVDDPIGIWIVPDRYQYH